MATGQPAAKLSTITAMPTPTQPDQAAFPLIIPPAFAGDVIRVVDGLTKREFFAALALQGLLAQPNAVTRPAGEAVMQADELIFALNRKTDA